MKKLTVGIIRRTSKRGNITYCLRWIMGQTANGKPKHHFERLFTTEAHPNKTRVKEWERLAYDRKREKEEEYNGEARKYVVYRKRTTGARYYLDHIDGSYSPHTVERHRATLQRANDYWDLKGCPDLMHNLTTYHVTLYREYLTEVGLCATSINTQLTVLSAWFRWALGESHVTFNPAKNCNRVLTSMTRRTMPIQSAAEMWDMIMSFEDETQRAIVGVIACTGIRKAEAQRLTVDDWDAVSDPPTLQIGSAYYGAERTKKHRRLLPVCPTAATWLAHLARTNTEGPLLISTTKGKSTIDKHVGSWLSPFGMTCQNLRAWLRTALETCGAREYAIDYLLGHVGTRIRQSYTPPENFDACCRAVRLFETWFASGNPAWDDDD